MLSRALPPALLSLLITITKVTAAPYDLEEKRALAPLTPQGLPTSYRPDRNPARFPYDIGGIVGGYVVAVLFWLVLVLTVGRTMRRKALQPPQSLELQDKPTAMAFKSPTSARSWFKVFKKSDSTTHSPPLQSPLSFDQKVVDAHRDAAQADMERLYAAVMDHDARKGSKVSVDESEGDSNERRRPSAADDSPISPVKVILPPDFRNAPNTASTPPLSTSPRGILSKRSQGSLASANAKSARFNLKNLRISGAAQKYPGARSDDEARTPLSPQFQGTQQSPRTNQSTPRTPYDQIEEIDEVQPLPRATPQRIGSATSTSSSLPLRSFTESLKSPGIQTTVLDRRVEKLQMTPKTGVPFTPYSPYMPFTPITPVASHLMSKKDRKMMQKTENQRRATRKEDMVQSPKEIFGDAY